MPTHTYLKLIHKNYALLTAFCEKYPLLFTNDNNLDYISGFIYSETCLHFRDAALCGDILGKDGWIRHVVGTFYNWHRTIDGINIVITHAEAIVGNETPVPPTAFPLQLENPE